MVLLYKEDLVLLLALALPLQPQEDSLDRPVLHQLLVVMELRLLVVCLVVVLLRHPMVHRRSPLVLVLLPQLLSVRHSPGAMEDLEVRHQPLYMEDTVLLRSNSSISSRALLNSTEPPPCQSM
jgi:hypothetical protein